MKITVVGTGYVGLVSGVCFSDLGHHVFCIDKDEQKIEKLNRHESPIYEPGLEQLMIKNSHLGRLHFSHDLREAVEQSQLVLLAVGTPSLPNGEANLAYIEEAAREVALVMNEDKIIVIKSTVPVGTNERIFAIMSGLTAYVPRMASVPEFLREGTAIADTFNPDRIVIGTENEKVASIITELHLPLTENILVTNIRSAEMIKYASNAFLATKISFINEIANICDKVGANVSEVAHGMGMDRRIGSSFLRPGIGYGGSCFPKDTGALIQIAGNVNYEFKLLKAVVEVNRDQRMQVIKQLKNALGELRGRTIGIWGLAFKPNTDDVRDAPAFDIVSSLIEEQAHIQLYDPIAMDKFRAQLDHSQITWCDSALQTAKQADALCLLTEWEEFKVQELKEVASIMRGSIFIDGRNVYREEQINESGLHYYSIGRPDLKTSLTVTLHP